MSRPVALALGAFALGASILASAAPARAEDTCASAYEGAQERRRAGELTRARAELRLCERTCPKKLAADCSAWKQEIEPQLAAVTLAVVDAAGRPAPAASVVVDGVPVSTITPGAPLDLDPGHHTIEASDGDRRGRITFDLARGQRDARVTVRLDPAASPSSSSTAGPRRPPLVAWVLGGVGVAALGAGAAMGIAGQAQKSSLEETCAPLCKKARDVDPIARLWTAGAITAAAGAALLGAATAAWIVEDRRARPVSLVLAPGYLGARGSF